MMGSRKFFVLPAALALALVGSSTALGQFCNVVPGTGRDVRAEGPQRAGRRYYRGLQRGG